MLNNGIISLNFMKSERNLVDPLTKPLDRKLVRETSKRIGLVAQSWVKCNANPTYVTRDLMK